MIQGIMQHPSDFSESARLHDLPEGPIRVALERRLARWFCELVNYDIPIGRATELLGESWDIGGEIARELEK